MNHIVTRLIFVLLLFLFGCAPPTKIKELVFPTQCQNACWMGIEPNVSTADEAAEVLGKIYGSKNIIRDDDAGSITWDANNTTWHNSGIVLYQNNLVHRVLVWFTEDSVEVKDIITEFGDPHSVGLVPSGPDIKCAAGLLLYPQIGVHVNLSQIGESVGVSENQGVSGLGISSPWASDNQLWADAIPWDGYHEYCPENGLGKNKMRANTACTRLVGVCAFSSTLCGLKLVPAKWRCPVPPTSG